MDGGEDLGSDREAVAPSYTRQDFLEVVHFVDIEGEVELTVKVLNGNQIEFDCVI